MIDVHLGRRAIDFPWGIDDMWAHAILFYQQQCHVISHDFTAAVTHHDASCDNVKVGIHVCLFLFLLFLKPIPFLTLYGFYSYHFFIFICFRLPQHRWSGCQRELRASGPDPGFKVDQREHWLLRRRFQPHHRIRIWDRSFLCQFAHPLPSLRR